MLRLKFSNSFYFYGAGIVALSVLSHLRSELTLFVDIAFYSFLAILALEFFQLYNKGQISCVRIVPDRFSNGDFNEIILKITNSFRFDVNLSIYDEMPYQLQISDYNIDTQVKANETKTIKYEIKPLERGEYVFKNINLYMSTSLNLVQRKFILEAEQKVPVYPSYIQMHDFSLMAFESTQKRDGLKKIRKIGQSREFEQVKHYVQGDDVRFINWSATARKSDLMVNQYQDEISQNIYSVIDMGRNMMMPFHGMSLLDYAINASLALSNVIIKKYDRAGLFTFSDKAGSFLKADSHLAQVQKIADRLYHQSTDFLESNFELLFQHARTMMKGRSLIILYTNFEGISSMRRQLKYLKAINRMHILLVVFFENTELFDLVNEESESLEDIYTKTIGMQFIMEKRQIVKELNQNGIYTLLTDPNQLTVNTINKYLEFKNRGLI